MINITRPTMSLTLDGVEISRHRSEVEAMEAASENGPGTYVLERPDATIVVQGALDTPSDPIDEDPVDEPTDDEPVDDPVDIPPSGDGEEPRPDPTPGVHPFFESLQAHPGHHKTASLRRQEEIDEYSVVSRGRSRNVYDPVKDACKFTILKDRASLTSGDQVRIKWPEINEGTMLVYWEGQMPSYWVQDGAIEGTMTTHKAFQIGRDKTRGGERVGGNERGFEPRHNYSKTPAPHFARTDVRIYIKGVERGGGDSVKGQKEEFRLLPDVWTYYAALIDIDGGSFSYWVGDETRQMTCLIDQSPIPIPTPYWDWFWFEWNSSQQRIGPETNCWGRNLAVLKDLSFDEADALLRSR